MVLGLLSAHAAAAVRGPQMHSHAGMAEGWSREAEAHGRRADAEDADVDDANADADADADAGADDRALAYNDEAEAYRVTDLPGLNGTALDFGQFAGFIDLRGDGTEGM